jgi:hypothetical protein
LNKILKNDFYFLIAIILSVNAIGILLRMFDLPVYIIILGFRFHLSLLIPFFFIMLKLNEDLVKKEFTSPRYKKNYPFLFSLFLPALAFILMYILQQIDWDEPEFQYEFGLSSVVDFPIYLIWNSIHLIAFYFFLLVISSSRYPFILLLLTIPLLFIYQFIPLNSEIFLWNEIPGLFAMSLYASLLILRFRNIYWFTVSVFFVLWLYILLFGSSYTPLINLIFASQYSSWEGFFEMNKSIAEYSFTLYVLFITSVMFLISLKQRKN